MPLKFDVFTASTLPVAVEAAWDQLAADNADVVQGLDGTTGAHWFRSLTAAFPAARQARLLVARDQHGIVAILPLIPAAGRATGKHLMLASELYGGRNGFLLQRHDPTVLGDVFDNIKLAAPGWQSLRLTLVAGGPSERLLRGLTDSLGYKTIVETSLQSPYFPLLENDALFSAGVSKSLKQTIRTSRNKLLQLGEVVFAEIGGPAFAAQAINDVLAIERGSWKQAAGSAITCNLEQEAFYAAIFKAAPTAGQLFGLVCYVNETPIAYNFGLLRSGIYSCLKHSNRDDYQAYSPGQYLNSILIERLRARSVVVYDFMGKPEPHKLRWSPQTEIYNRLPILVYNRSLAGRVAFGARVLKRAVAVPQHANATEGHTTENVD